MKLFLLAITATVLFSACCGSAQQQQKPLPLQAALQRKLDEYKAAGNSAAIDIIMQCKQTVTQEMLKRIHAAGATTASVQGDMLLVTGMAEQLHVVLSLDFVRYAELSQSSTPIK